MNRLATLDDMHSYYSDLYKSVYGIRPRWVTFGSIAEAGDEIEKLEAQAQAQYEEDQHWDNVVAEREQFKARMGTDQDWIPATKFEVLAGEPI